MRVPLRIVHMWRPKSKAFNEFRCFHRSRARAKHLATVAVGGTVQLPSVAAQISATSPAFTRGSLRSNVTSSLRFQGKTVRSRWHSVRERESAAHRCASSQPAHQLFGRRSCPLLGGCRVHLASHWTQCLSIAARGQTQSRRHWARLFLLVSRYPRARLYSAVRGCVSVCMFVLRVVTGAVIASSLSN